MSTMPNTRMMSQKVDVRPHLPFGSSGCPASGSSPVLTAGPCPPTVRVPRFGRGVPVGMKPHIFRAPPHENGHRDDREHHHQPAEQCPHLTPIDERQQPGHHQGNGHLGDAVTHMGEGHGPPPHPDEPPGHRDVHHEVAHQRMAHGHQGHSHGCELQEGMHLPQQQKPDRRKGRAGDHHAARAVSVQLGPHPGRHEGVQEMLARPQQRELPPGHAEIGGKPVFRKNAEGAGEEEGAGDVGEKGGADDVPAIEEPRPCRGACGIRSHGCPSRLPGQAPGCAHRHGWRDSDRNRRAYGKKDSEVGHRHIRPWLARAVAGNPPDRCRRGARDCGKGSFSFTASGMSSRSAISAMQFSRASGCGTSADTQT